MSPLTNTPSSQSSPTGQKAPDRDMFLTLLVAQLKNQDPLQPQDGMQFVAQLAQFSQLDQLITINQKLDALGGSGS
jgi:flagellar basal-body rod modification protein FlgD